MRPDKYLSLMLSAILFAFLLSNTAEAPIEAISKEKKYLPKELRKIKFGMSYEKVSKLRKELTDVSETGYDFRKVYQENPGKGGIESIVYYFNNQADLPLYEIIINYESAGLRDAAVEKLLGSPNYKEKEWTFDIDAPYPLHAWTYKNKLIFAVPLKGSEWEDGI